MHISIFIPTYNARTYIVKTLHSVLSQSYYDIEVICVDDGSTDGTCELLLQCAEKDSRLKVLQKSHEGSVPYAWNFVMPHLQGEFTLYMSQDDLLAPDCLRNLVDAVSSTEVDAVIPSVTFFEKDMALPESSYEEINKRYALFGKVECSGKEAFNDMLDYSIPGFALWRTTKIRTCGMPTHSFNSDEGMQRLWMLHCRRVAFAPRARFGYRQSEASIARGLKAYHFRSLCTQIQLWTAMNSHSSIVPEERRRQLQYDYFCSLFYLKAQYPKHRKTFSSDEDQRLKYIFKRAYKHFSDGLQTPNTQKGRILRLAASSYCWWRFLTTLYALKSFFKEN